MSNPEFKVMGILLSAPSRVVFTFLGVNSIPFELVPFDLHGMRQQTAEYSAINRYGQFPVLIHGDVSVGESFAIVQYIAEVKGLSNNWWPGDIKERAKVVSFLHWFNSGPCQKIRKYHFQLFPGPTFYGLTFTDEQLQEAKRDCDETVQKIDDMLSYGLYAAGTQQPSAADLALFSMIQQNIYIVHYDISGFRHLKEWFETIEIIDGLKEIHQQFVQKHSRL